MNCWWHKWTKWEQYAFDGICHGSVLIPINPPIKISENRQKRNCEKCGKVEDELI